MKASSFVALSIAAAIAAGAAVPAAAQEPPGVRLSLAECLRAAMENNLDLVIARKDPQIAERQIEVREAIFDGAFSAAASYGKDTGDLTIRNNIDGSTNEGSDDSDRWSTSVAWNDLMQFGGSYRATLAYSSSGRSSRQVSSFTGFFTDSSFDSTPASLSLHYEMPLLRGFGAEVNTFDVLLARGGLDVSRQDLRLRAMQTLKDVEDAYWDLVAVREALQVARESLTLAQDLLDLNRKKVEVGTLAPIEVTQAEAGVASREEGVILAETAVLNAEDNLRRLLAVPKDDPSWFQAIEPSDRARFEERAVDAASALESAIEHRPELRAARQRLRDSELAERVARNATRHSLTLSADATPSQSEEEFRLLQLLPGGTPSLTNSTTDRDAWGWQIGLTYGIPLGNRQAKASYAIATLEREKTELGLANLEQTIRVDVRTAVRNVESGVKRVAAARASTVLQRKTLDAEQKKFENGMSTSFEVLRIQTDLSNARLAEIRAVLDYTKALADLERAKGTLLEARGMRLELTE